jgi:hypothetical protein
MADKIDPRKDNKDAESGEPVQLDKDQQQGGQQRPQQQQPGQQQGGERMPHQPGQPGGEPHEGGQKR